MAGVLRPELQGLRAIAVGLVIAFHLHPAAVPGGYIGVDVFFVISGFLITGQLLAMGREPGGISPVRFWAGRIRRLLPAASVVLAACLVAMLVVVPPSQWQRTLLEIVSSALYVENWTLAVHAVDYLGGDEAPTLVQHFWSLSVEEQFYLVWPLLLMAALALRRRRAVAVALAVVFAASLTYSIARAGDPGSYFDTGARAWEFAAGGLLALAPGIRMPRAAAAVASWVGVALIAAAAALLSGATPFPGAAALLPVAGAVVVIAAGTGPRWSAGSLIAIAPMRYLGDISYSLYLWHWPVVVIGVQLLDGPLDPTATIVALAVTLVLSALTKRFVEDPPRRSPSLAGSRRLTYATAVATVVVLVGAVGVAWGGLQAGSAATAATAQQLLRTDPCFGAGAMRHPDACPDPFDAAGVDTAFAAQDRGVLTMGCDSPGAEVVECVFGPADAETTVAVVGNSHAAVLVPALQQHDPGMRIVLLRKTFCLGVSTLPYPQPAGADCTAWTEAARERVLADDIDAVLFAGHRNALYYLAGARHPDFDVAELRPHIEAGFEQLLAAGKGVAVVGDTPGTRPVPSPECLHRHRDAPERCSTPVPDDGLDDGNVLSLAAQAVPGVAYRSLMPTVCDALRCHPVVGDAVVYFDDNHLTATFARTLGPEVGSVVDEALRLAWR